MRQRVNENVYPHKRWDNAEAASILRRFNDAVNSVPELKAGCLYFLAVSVPSDETSDEGAPMARVAYWLSAHPHTATMVANAMGSVHPPMLADMAAVMGRLSMATTVRDLELVLESEPDGEPELFVSGDDLTRKPS